jgi:hypothetical protein
MKAFHIIFILLLCYEWTSIIKATNGHSVEGENSPRNHPDKGILLSETRKDINWAVRKKRNWIVLFEGQEVQNDEINNSKPQKRVREKRTITDEQRNRYNQRKRLNYAARDKGERTLMSKRIYKKQQERLEKLSPEERLAIRLNKNAYRRQKDREDRLKMTEQQKEKIRELKRIRSKNSYLKKKIQKL